ncbi:MAG: O-antigen ligase family protein [Vulcanibacillus sp.]
MKINKKRIVKYCFAVGYLIFEFVELLKLFNPIVDTIIPDGLIGSIFIACFLIGFLLRIRDYNRYISTVFIIIFLAFTESAIIHGNTGIITDIIKSNTSLIIFVMMLFYSTELDPENRIQELRIISYLLIGINLIRLFTGGYYDENLNFSYMGFGYGTVVYWTIITRYAFLDKEIKDILISLSVGLLMILFGNRGVILIEITVIYLLIMYYWKLKNKILLAVSSIIFTIVIYIFFTNINLVFLNLAESFGLPSYTLERAINKELLNDSGRNIIWEQVWHLLVQKPLSGYGIGYDRLYIGTHTHNLVLEIMLNFGILIGILFCIALTLIMFDLLRSNRSNQWRDLFLVYFIPSTIMLMFSNSIYYSRDFWIAISIYCAFKNSCRIKYKKKEDTKHVVTIDNNMVRKEISDER